MSQKKVTTNVVFMRPTCYLRTTIVVIMDAPKGRQILFNKKAHQPQAEKKEVLKPLKQEVQPNPVANPPKKEEAVDKSAKILAFIKERPYLNMSGICKEVGMDKGNFSRVRKAENGIIPAKYIQKFEQSLKRYGYL
jgi:methylphosphotriester-DNA--protein-cysteine methyltransferase